MKPVRQRTLILGLIVVGIAIIGFFGLRTFRAFKQFHGHRPPHPGQIVTDVNLIRDWMTIPYIAMTYHAHPKLLFDAVGIDPKGNEEKSLAELNEEYYPQDSGVVIEKVKAAVSANQPPVQPTPPP